jgi:hypothetical protein
VFVVLAFSEKGFKDMAIHVIFGLGVDSDDLKSEL